MARKPVSLFLLVSLCALSHAAQRGSDTDDPRIRVGLYDNAPKIHRSDDGKPTGFWPALLHTVARREGWRLEWVPCTWAKCTRLLGQGEIDLLPDMARTAERERRFAFNDEVALVSWSRVYQAPGAGIETIPDLEGRRIAVLKGSVNYLGEDGIAELLTDFRMSARFVERDSYRAVLAAVGNGQADAGVTNKDFGNRYEDDYRVRRTPITFSPAGLYFALPRDGARNAVLIPALDRQLRRMKADNDSVYYRLLSEHLGVRAEPKPVLPAWVAPAAAGAGLMMVLLLAGNLVLNRVVFRRTAALRDESRERAAAEHKLANRDIQLEAFMENAPAAIYVKNTAGEYKAVNPVFETLLGLSRDRILGREDTDLLPPLEAKRLRDNDLRVLGSRHAETTEEALTLQGQMRSFLSTKFPLFNVDNEVIGICGISLDMTSAREHQDEIRYLAQHDPLTRLPNRHRLEQFLKYSIEDAAAEGTGFAVAFIDLNSFKDVNDNLGHTTGDQLLQALAQRLREILRTDDVVARAGGDEFIVLLKGLRGRSQVEEALRKLLRHVTEPFFVGPQEVSLSVSIGTTRYPDDGVTCDELLRNADAAMYDARRRGRNQITHYHPGLTEASRKRFELEAAIRRGIADGEFFLVYQPQIDLESGTVAGLEALVRWNRPETGLVSPGDFIPVAEASGLIVDLDASVLEQACRQARTWLDQGVAFSRISVNISALELGGTDFAERILAAIEYHDLPPDCLGIEVTESMLMENIADVYERLRTLRERGVFISIDDFGTGYSSLSYLKRLQVNELKIDKSFIDELPDMEYDRAICETVIQMGRHLGLEVIAEGVETRDQALFLHEKGSARAQGFWYTRPLPPEELVEWMNNHTAFTS